MCVSQILKVSDEEVKDCCFIIFFFLFEQSFAGSGSLFRLPVVTTTEIGKGRNKDWKLEIKMKRVSNS